MSAVACGDRYCCRPADIREGDRVLGAHHYRQQGA